MTGHVQVLSRFSAPPRNGQWARWSQGQKVRNCRCHGFGIIRPDCHKLSNRDHSFDLSVWHIRP